MATSLYSRTTHTVRIKSQDQRFYADVEVLDAISMTLPNNFDIVFQITASQALFPNIVDNTGDNNGKPGNKFSTRASHMLRMTGQSDPTQIFDIEVCDSFTITGPNDLQFAVQCPTPGFSNAAVTDDTDSGLAVAANALSTRAQHVVKLTRQVGGTQQVTTDYLLEKLTDAMVYGGPQQYGMPYINETDEYGPADIPYGDLENSPIWGEAHVLQFYNFALVVNGALQPGATTNDTTVYVIDPRTNQLVPPPNTDPNVYVYFPNGTEYPGAQATSGPFLGAGQAIDMGPIWWIKAVGTTDNVWFWYLNPVQQPLATSFFGVPPDGADPKWGYRGFTLLPDFPVAWLLSVNYPLEPMGTYGAPDLNTAASGYIDNGQITVNWFGVGIPDGGWGVNTAIGDQGALVEAGFANYLAPITYQGTTYYMPYGAFDMMAPSSAEILAATAAVNGNTSLYTDYGGPPPNIWELTGVQQPPLTKPGKVWNATTNPHQQPSLSQAQQVAQTFAENWNLVAEGVNQAVREGITPAGIVGFPFLPPPGWNWARPYGGDSIATAQQFSNGWVPAVLAVETVPITVPTIAVGQLDPTLWDVDPVVTAGNPPVLYTTHQP